jgi:hypothetical protein
VYRVHRPLAGSSIGRTPAFGAGCWRFEPSPASQVPDDGRLVKEAPAVPLLTDVKAVDMRIRRADRPLDALLTAAGALPGALRLL